MTTQYLSQVEYKNFYDELRTNLNKYLENFRFGHEDIGGQEQPKLRKKDSNVAKESDVSFAKESTDVSFGEWLGGRDAYKIGAPARAVSFTRHNLVLAVPCTRHYAYKYD